ncbi:MAG: metal-dependent hydrolase, partial [Dehalococcoidales bacterium]|nr:metal-dependent hydrolase [Dehalococcoidales bacterium]
NMLILGHAGITLGAAVLLSGAMTAFRSPIPRQENTAVASPDDSLSRLESWLTSLARHVDIRLLLIASLLPDIIDKPLGHIFFREALSNGRTIGHTLFFLILITLAGLFLYRRGKKTWLLVLSFGTLTHLILDQMWKTHETLLWPFFGFAFEKHDITTWIPDIIDNLTVKPGVYIPEIVGGLVLIWFAWEVLRRRKLLSFIKYGRI